MLKNMKKKCTFLKKTQQKTKTNNNFNYFWHKFLIEMYKQSPNQVTLKSIQSLEHTDFTMQVKVKEVQWA